MQKIVLLQYQPWRENDFWLDSFSAQGRQSLLLNRPAAPPDLFHLYQGDWPVGVLPAIKGWQTLQHWPLTNTALYCGLYLNELLGLLLPENEPQPQLFQQYCQTLDALADNSLPDPWLRLFEWHLLQALGYGFSWHKDAQERDIHPSSSYQFKPRLGFVLAAAAAPLACSGKDLLAIHQGSRTLQHWRIMRVVLRMALEDILPRPLLSRALLSGQLS